jgi:hypothetical protein
MTQRRKTQFIQLLLIAIAWVIIGLIIQTYDHFLLHSTAVESLAPFYSTGVNYLFTTVATFFGALLIGVFLSSTSTSGLGIVLMDISFY